MSRLLIRTPRVALVGCSWFARAAHIPALNRLHGDGLIELVALCSRSSESLELARQLIDNDIDLYTDFNKILDRDDVDVVDLVLPTTIMSNAVSLSLLAGKHVISEKPCAADVLQCLELMKTWNNGNSMRYWSVAENWPFKPTIQVLKNIIRSGRLGDIQSVDFKFLVGGGVGPGWRTSSDYRGGNLLDVGVHFVSMLRLITGGILEVNAKVSWLEPTFVANKVTADLIFENNVKGKFNVSFTGLDLDNEPYHLTIKFKNATIKVNFSDSQLIIEEDGLNQIIEVPNDPWVEGGVYSMLRHFFEALSSGDIIRSSPVESMKDVASIHAMIESSRLNSPVSPSILYNQLVGSAPIINTFAGLQNFRPKYFVDALGLQDLRATINEGASRGLKIRALGNGYSWSPYIKTKDISVRLSGFKNIIKIDLDKKTILAGAGARLGEITAALSEKNLCLPSLPFITNSTIGGAVATATHGTSPHFGTLSDFIRSMKLVASCGETLSISDEINKNFFHAARVSVGMLGIITELELQAVPMPWVKNYIIDLTLDEFTNLKTNIFAQFEHIWMHWILGQERIVVQGLETRKTPHEGFSPYVSGEGPNWVMTYQNLQEPPSGEFVMLSMQYCIPLEMLDTAIRKINESDFSSDHHGREIEIKLLKKNTASYLGPNSDYDCALFNTWWAVESNEINYIFQRFEEIMNELNARPHWGKFHKKPNIEDMSKIYPNWDKFNDVRRQLDPKELFSIF